MKIRLTILSVLLFSSVSIGQNTERFGQVNFAQGLINPAAIAIDGPLMFDMIFRDQWMGVEGAPMSAAFNGQYEINQTMATGLTFSYDRIGVNQTTSVTGQYAYRVHFNHTQSINFGLGLGIDNVVNHLAGTQTTQADDPAFATSYSRTFFNASFGVYYNAPKWYIGIGIPRLFQNTQTGPEPGFQPPRWHHFLTTGFYINAGENYTFQPNIQIKVTGDAPIQGDLILRNSFMNRFSIVVGYRSENSIIAGFDVRISRMARFGYSFNYDVGSLSRVKGMSNELYIGLAFPYHSDRADFSNRRYISRKGGNKSDYKRHSRDKQWKRGRRYGRKHRYRR